MSVGVVIVRETSLYAVFSASAIPSFNRSHSGPPKSLGCTFSENSLSYARSTLSLIPH